MERIALFYNGGILYWNSVIITLAALAAICGFLWLYVRKSGNLTAALVTVPLSLGLSLLLSRFVHWYSFSETYPGIVSALTDYSAGGFALIGAFAGCFLAALLTRTAGLHKDTPEMLDCMCLAGGAAIAAGRLSSFFNATDRGQIIEHVRSLPWVYPVINSVSGATEYRLATFLLQSIAVALITIALMVFYHRKNDQVKNGDTALLFLLCYGASQIILDSTRYDSIYFRGNGFISIEQVFAALAVALVIVVFSVRMVKRHGLILWNLLMWVEILASIGCAGYMEYHVQRHGNQALFAYSIMTLCLVLVVGSTVFIYNNTLKPKHK